MIIEKSSPYWSVNSLHLLTNLYSSGDDDINDVTSMAGVNLMVSA